MRIFVTVGTTRFDGLIHTVLSSNFLDELLKYGLYHSMAIQFGNSSCEHGETSFVHPKAKSPVKSHSKSTTKNNTNQNSLLINLFKFKPSLNQDMMDADLIISHAGSGSMLESLDLGKKLIVVVNDSLMDNHQLELATKLHDEGYLVSCCVEDLMRNIVQIKAERKEFITGKGSTLFQSILNNLVQDK